MSPKKRSSRNAVSFNQFRRYQLTAFRSLRSTFTAEECGAPADAIFIAWACEIALADGRFADAVQLAKSLAEQQYGDSRSYRLGTQLAALVRKVPFKDPALDPEGTALQKFLQSESDCRETNLTVGQFRRFYEGLDCQCSVADDAQRMVKLLHRARAHVHRVMGAKPPLDRIYAYCRFSKGSSVGVHGDATHFLKKLSAPKWTVSHAAEPYVRAAFKAAPMIWAALGVEHRDVPQLYADPDAFSRRMGPEREPTVPKVDRFDDLFAARIEYVDYDIITYVLKQADSHRTVGTQPLGNVFVQLGAGDYMRDEVLLRRCGIDIREGQLATNGPLALLGSSCEGMTFATIDLSSASDCICTELVRYLLPWQWFVFLNSIRTPSYLLPGDKPGEERRYEKFCAMGNGFCFPLETVIFWSLLQAVYDLAEVPDRTCAVYGDDIIVYQSAALELIELLSSVGFETNTSKTFVHGPFRESCGQDFYNGINVRPVVLDEVFEHESQVYHFVNSLQRKGYTNLAEQLREMCGPGALKRPYPGDTTTALEVPLDEFMASRHARCEVFDSPKDDKTPWYQSWSWLEFLPRPVLDTDEYDAANHLHAALFGASSGNGGVPTFAFRRKVETRVRRVAHG